MELLSPAGTLEAGMAAFQYGADAVYLGMQDFSARADAGNFSPDELRTLLGVARKASVPRKVYVAVNTLVREEELPRLISLLAQLEAIGVDALIVQDLAVVQLVREHFPRLPLHASTQMAVHNAEGVLQAQRLGFTRVVAARECTVSELEAMCAVPGMEIEAFIHGALCWSYSGLCQLSACLHGPSGNRGECTYVCRNRFQIQDEHGRLLDTCCPCSMKDLALGEFLPSFARAGVASLKIEGRKKTPLYVAAVTNYYRKMLDHSFQPGEETQAELDVKTIFSRPWTQLFASSQRVGEVTDPRTTGPRGIEAGVVARVRRTADGDFLRFTVRNRPLEKHDGLQLELPGEERPWGFGVNEIHTFTQGGQERRSTVFEARPGTIVEVPLPSPHPEIPVGTRIFCASSQAVKRRYSWPEPRISLDRERTPLQFQIDVTPRCLRVQTNRADGTFLAETILNPQEPLAPARNPDALEPSVREAFARLGDTPFVLDSLTLHNPQNLFLPRSTLNELRRMAAEDAQEALERTVQQCVSRATSAVQEWFPTPEGLPRPAWSIKIDRPHFLDLLHTDLLASLEEVVFAIDRTPAQDLPSVLEALAERVGRDRIRISLPVICRHGGPHDWRSLLPSLVAAGWNRWELGNLGTFDILHAAGVTPDNADLTADWSLYTTNRLAAKAWLSLGLRRVALCPEDLPENWERLATALGDRLTVIAWQHPVLARSATCLNASLHGGCVGRRTCTFTTMRMTGPRGERLLAVNDRCQTILLQDSPLEASLHDLYDAGARRFRADFLWKDHAPLQIRDVMVRLTKSI
ncbi:MAG: U32 family peptidase [Victivallales bacterium]|nr:U32 family peptidase [Victivallales bacterium]